MSMTVEQLIARKGGQYFYVQADSSVDTACQMLVERNVGALLVVERDELIGIVSERDCVQRVMAKRRDAKATRVRDVMTPRPITIEPTDTIDHCMSVMTNARVRHLPVMAGKHVLGVVTLGDTVHAVLGEQEQLIEQLEVYIVGSPASMRPPAA